MDNPSEKDVTISSYKRFLEVFCRDVEEPSPEENDSPVRHVSYMLEPTEIEGESLQWALDYLSQMHGCPAGLAEQVARAAFQRVAQQTLQDFLHTNNKTQSSESASATLRIENRRLQQEVEGQVHRVCTEWNQQLPPFVRPPLHVFPVSVHAIKNTRRRMEDRHVILSDLNTLFQLQNSPSQSYYAVFDGHGGAEAAMFSACQLHVNLMRDGHFVSNPPVALKRAYAATDRQFLRKAQEMKLRSGTTGVNMLVRGEDCYISWLGDSQAMMVRDGQAIHLMDPHKPEREDERQRIERLGGFVTNAFGVWRVNGNVSVSRAIGDIGEKPYLCSEADVSRFQLTGREDYVVLACDGVWDVLRPVEVPHLVHSYLLQQPGDLEGVARHLVLTAQHLGSGDNISCIVVFLRRHPAPPVGAPPDGFPLLRENGELDESASDVSGSHHGGSSGASTASGVTGVSRLSLSSVAEGGESSTGDNGAASLYSPGRQIQSDFPHRLERQTGFFLPSLRSLRTGHHKQQLLPLQQGRHSLATSSDQDSAMLDSARKEEQAHRSDNVKKVEHSLKPVTHQKPPSKRGSTKRKSKQRRRRSRTVRADSPASSARDSVSVDQSQGDDVSLSSFVPSHRDSLARHTSLAEILQQMADPADNKASSDGQDFLSVRGTSAHLHDALPRIPSRAPSSLRTSTTSMTPVSTSRLSALQSGYTAGHGKSRPYNT